MLEFKNGKENLLGNQTHPDEI